MRVFRSRTSLDVLSTIRKKEERRGKNGWQPGQIQVSALEGLFGGARHQRGGRAERKTSRLRCLGSQRRTPELRTVTQRQRRKPQGKRAESQDPAHGGQETRSLTALAGSQDAAMRQAAVQATHPKSGEEPFFFWEDLKGIEGSRRTRGSKKQDSKGSRLTTKNEIQRKRSVITIRRSQDSLRYN